MINQRINKLEIEGNNNIVFQYIDGQGNVNEEHCSFKEFLKPFISRYQNQIEQYQEQINLHKQRLSDKEKIEALLNEKIRTLSGEINKLSVEIEKREKEVVHLLKEYQNKDFTAFSDSHKKAFNLFISGSLEEAKQLLSEAELEKEEVKLIKNARKINESRILKARILRVEQKYQEAGINYEKALKFAPEWQDYFEVATFFQQQNNYEKSDKHFNYCLLSVQSKSDKITVLNSIGTLKSDKNDFAQAHSCYEEAIGMLEEYKETSHNFYLRNSIQIRNNRATLFWKQGDLEKAKKDYTIALISFADLPVEDQGTYLKQKASIHNNLGIINDQNFLYQESKFHYLEALKIRLSLYNQHSQAEKSELAGTYNNLGLLSREMNLFDEAKKYLDKALTTYEALVEENAETYLPATADIYNNLGLLYESITETGKPDESATYDKALNYYKKSLNIRKQLVEKVHKPYRSELGMTFHNMASAQMKSEKYNDAGENFAEALKIRSALVEEAPSSSAYLSDKATTLNDMATLQRITNDFVKSKQNMLRALEIRNQLAIKNPDFYEIDLAHTFLNLSLLYNNFLQGDQFKVTFAQQALVIYNKYRKEIPNIEYWANYIENNLLSS